LDRGEFEQIINALEQQVSSMTANEYAKAAIGEARELLTGHESLTSEWRDFGRIMRLFQYRVLVENPKVQKALVALASTSPFQ
jgi:hypothetical protein